MNASIARCSTHSLRPLVTIARSTAFARSRNLPSAAQTRTRRRQHRASAPRVCSIEWNAILIKELNNVLDRCMSSSLLFPLLYMLIWLTPRVSLSFTTSIGNFNSIAGILACFGGPGFFNKAVVAAFLLEVVPELGVTFVVARNGHEALEETCSCCTCLE